MNLDLVIFIGQCRDNKISKWAQAVQREVFTWTVLEGFLLSPSS